MAMTHIESLKQLAKGARIGKQLPAKQLPDGLIRLQDQQMAHMLGPRQHAHHEHHNDLGHLIIGGGASLDGQPLLQDSRQANLLSKFPQIDKAGILGQILRRVFCRKCLHLLGASCNGYFGGYCNI
jgi:hypothetical protein